MKKPTVHIVHHIDTEGPLYEPLPELFCRIEQMLGLPLNMEASKDNLRILQSENFVFHNKDTDKILKKIIAPGFLDFKTSWYDVEEMLDRILSWDYRSRFKDSFDGAWIYNWHILDHVGFVTNPRRREMGYSSVFNIYRDKLRSTKSSQDSLQWHFHPVPFNRAANISATSYMNSAQELTQVLCRRLIDAQWFPVVNRAGFHTVRPDSNWWLEQWLPFDASNQAIADDHMAFVDNVDGRFGDWRGAPDDWSLYHPDLYDWRKPGMLKRTIARCLNMNTRFRNITVAEFEKAFALAQRTGKDIYVGFANHDFREMSGEIESVYAMLLQAASGFNDVNFKFNDTISAFRACLEYDEDMIKNDSLDFDAELQDNLLKIVIKRGAIFGSQPFLAMKTTLGSYHSDNFDFGVPGSHEYFYTFDHITFSLDQLSTIAVAANDKYGHTCIKTITI